MQDYVKPVFGIVHSLELYKVVFVRIELWIYSFTCDW